MTQYGMTPKEGESFNVTLDVDWFDKGDVVQVNGKEAYVDYKVPMTDMDWSFGGMKGYKDYELTPEEHAKFDAVEGCTPEQIEMAKKVFCKTNAKKKESWTSGVWTPNGPAGKTKEFKVNPIKS